MISIVIPSWNGLHLLETCLPGVLEQMNSEIELIVVDNGSVDGTVEWLAREYPSVICISLPENRGFSGAVNAGITKAGRRDVILLNNDTTACDGWLQALVDAADKYPEFQIFTSRVLVADSPHLVDTIGDGFTIAGFGYKIGWLQLDSDVTNQTFEPFSASGCALYISRNVFDEIGLFDEDFFAFGEDLDFSFRARLAGFQILFVPDARILHSVRATAAGEKTLFWYHRNLIWLLVKNLPWQLLVLYSPHIIFHLFLVSVRSIFRGWFSIYIRSLAAAARGLPLMFEKRRRIQKTRKIKLSELRRKLVTNWIGVHLMLHKAKNSAGQS